MCSTLGQGAIRRDEALVAAGRELSNELPESLRSRFAAFVDNPPPSGSMLIKGLPIGDLPPTPTEPRATTTKSDETELRLLTFAALLGEPVGYLPEQSGDVVQNILPVPSAATSQTSSSSSVDLMFHTEAAFHPHRPQHLLLFCLRGDPTARTTIASIFAALPYLDPDVLEVLFQPRFRCAVDESYLHSRPNVLGPVMPVLTGSAANPRMVFDEDLMVGIDEEADEALADLGTVLMEHRNGIVLEPGDLLVIDNSIAVHGRSPFRARFDGTDRWLQRAAVIPDLEMVGAERTGRVITTHFGG